MGQPGRLGGDLREEPRPRYRLDLFSIEPPALSRFADPYDPDRPPAPPDDFAAQSLSPVPQWPDHRLIMPVEGTGYLKLLDEGPRYESPAPKPQAGARSQAASQPDDPAPAVGRRSALRADRPRRRRRPIPAARQSAGCARPRSLSLEFRDERRGDVADFLGGSGLRHTPARTPNSTGATTPAAQALARRMATDPELEADRAPGPRSPHADANPAPGTGSAVGPPAVEPDRPAPDAPNSRRHQADRPRPLQAGRPSTPSAGPAPRAVSARPRRSRRTWPRCSSPRTSRWTRRSPPACPRAARPYILTMEKAFQLALLNSPRLSVSSSRTSTSTPCRSRSSGSRSARSSSPASRRSTGDRRRRHVRAGRVRLPDREPGQQLPLHHPGDRQPDLGPELRHGRRRRQAVRQRGEGPRSRSPTSSSSTSSARTRSSRRSSRSCRSRRSCRSSGAAAGP